MRELSLFTGAGGGVLGTKLLGWHTVGYVEIDNHCQKVIAQRIEDGILDRAPIFSDIRAFISDGYAGRYRDMVDVITAGFPCQPFSVAGKQQGENDARNMWPETIECIRQVRPNWVFLENVPGLLSAGEKVVIIAIEKIQQLNLFGAANKNSYAGRFIRRILSYTNGYFGQILRDLAESGYDARWRVLSAAEVGAPHKRDRLWIVCHSKRG